MSLFKSKALGICPFCNGPITEKDMRAGCSLCGCMVHHNCASNRISAYNPTQIGWFLRIYRLNAIFVWGRYQYSFCPKCQEVLKNQSLPPLIQRLELTARYDELAQLYEDFGFLAEAGKVRNQKNRHHVKNVNVDLNTLIEQMKSGNLSIPYKCSSCGASLTIGSGMGEGGVKYCSYCGSAINTEALLAVIQQALG